MTVRATMQKAIPLAALLAVLVIQPAMAEIKTAVFAAGCFWCTEADFDKVDGVLETTSGYTGGTEPSPTYEDVAQGKTTHLEAVKVAYDSEKIDYAGLLKVYWRNVDPFDDRGQFCDKGGSYRAAIFVGDDAERELAEATKTGHEKGFGRTIVTRILPRAEFYPAEEYHQNYHMKKPLAYKFYRYGCGRDNRLQTVWRNS